MSAPKFGETYANIKDGVSRVVVTQESVDPGTFVTVFPLRIGRELLIDAYDSDAVEPGEFFLIWGTYLTEGPSWRLCEEVE